MIAKISLIVALLLSAPFVANDEWVYSGTDTKAPKGKKAKVAAPIKIKTKLQFASSVSKANLVIKLSDGKQKFGKASILIQNGENIYMRPRLEILIPLAEAKKVAAGEPLLVMPFSHTGDDYEITLVHNPKSEIPDTVVKQK